MAAGGSAQQNEEYLAELLVFSLQSLQLVHKGGLSEAEFSQALVGRGRGAIGVSKKGTGCWLV